MTTGLGYVLVDERDKVLNVHEDAGDLTPFAEPPLADTYHPSMRVAELRIFAQCTWTKMKDTPPIRVSTCELLRCVLECDPTKTHWRAKHWAFCPACGRRIIEAEGPTT
jgi:hypothetical protein